MSDFFGNPPILPPSPIGNGFQLPTVPMGNTKPPVGAIKVGDRWVFPDLEGNLWPSSADAIQSNNDKEGTFSRGATGACPQNPDSLR